MAQPLSSINEFKQHITTVRPSLFRVTIPALNSVYFSEAKDKSQVVNKEGDFYFYCKAASLPASTLGEIPVAFMGRMFYEHGDREFDPWEITVYNTQDFAVRYMFEQWMNAMNLHQENRQLPSAAEGGFFSGNSGANYMLYMFDLRVQQLDRRNNVIAEYTFIDAFPTRVSDIPLDYGNQNTIEEFTVTLRYQYWLNNVEGQSPTVVPGLIKEWETTSTGVTNAINPAVLSIASGVAV